MEPSEVKAETKTEAKRKTKTEITAKSKTSGKSDSVLRSVFIKDDDEVQYGKIGG